MSAQMGDYPSVSEFVTDVDYWRIDCLGSLSFSDRPELYSQAVISIAASKANQKPTDETCWRTDLSNTREQRIEKIPIALLPILRTGDFWSRGRLAIAPKGYKKAEFFLGADELLRSKTVRLGDRLPWPQPSQGEQKPEFLLPYFQHPYHRLFTRAFCELLELPGSTTLLLIPHWEIIRFYFGSSTQLIETLFDTSKTIEDLVDSKRCTLSKEGHAHIHLRAHLPYASAEDVSRIYFCRQGRKAFNVLRNSLTVQAANGESVFPRTTLPIEKSTKLVMKGKYIKYQNGKMCFMCYELISCSAPFPYSSLTYFKDMPGDKNPNLDQTQLQPMTVRPQGRDEHKYRGSSIRQEDANTLFGTSTYNLSMESRFPYLDKINREKLRVDPHTHFAETGYIPQILVDQSEGVGKGGSKSHQSAKIVSKVHALNTAEKLSINFEYFFTAIEQLTQSNEISDCEFIAPTPDRNDPRCTVLPLAYTAEGRESKLCYIDYIKGYIHTAKLRRRAVIAKISNAKGISYLFEAEARVFKGRQLDNFPTFWVKALDSTELTDYEIEEILQSFSSNHRVWTKPSHFNHIITLHIRHPQKQKDDKRENYIEKLRQRFADTLNNH